MFEDEKEKVRDGRKVVGIHDGVGISQVQSNTEVPYGHVEGRAGELPGY